jgi:hypothetical protein
MTGSPLLVEDDMIGVTPEERCAGKPTLPLTRRRENNEQSSGSPNTMPHTSCIVLQSLETRLLVFQRTAAMALSIPLID